MGGGGEGVTRRGSLKMTTVVCEVSVAVVCASSKCLGEYFPLKCSNVY